MCKVLKNIAVGFLVAVFLGGCHGPENPKDKKKEEVVAVTVAKVIRKDMPFQIPAVGTVEPVRSVALSAQVGGVLQVAHFKEGETVKEGDLLFTLDPLLYEAQVREQEANLEKVKVEAENAANQVKRYEGLAQKEYVTQEQFEQAKAKAASLQAEIKAAQAVLEHVKLEAGYTQIHSPIAGKTGDILIKPGNVVRANDVTTPLVKIHQLKPILVRFAVSERYVTDILEESAKQTLSVRVRAPGEKEKEANGELSFVDNAVARETGTILLKAQFKNDDERLWPGQFVKVRLDLRTEKNVCVVPSEAVLTGQQGEYVWVVKPDDSVENRKVKTGFSFETEIVILEGLQEGETVVTDGHGRLSPQSKVAVKK